MASRMILAVAMLQAISSLFWYWPASVYPSDGLTWCRQTVKDDRGESVEYYVYGDSPVAGSPLRILVVDQRPSDGLKGVARRFLGSEPAQVGPRHLTPGTILCFMNKNGDEGINRYFEVVRSVAKGQQRQENRPVEIIAGYYGHSNGDTIGIGSDKASINRADDILSKVAEQVSKEPNLRFSEFQFHGCQWAASNDQQDFLRSLGETLGGAKIFAPTHNYQFVEPAFLFPKSGIELDYATQAGSTPVPLLTMNEHGSPEKTITPIQSDSERGNPDERAQQIGSQYASAMAQKRKEDNAAKDAGRKYADAKNAEVAGKQYADKKAMEEKTKQVCAEILQAIVQDIKDAANNFQAMTDATNQRNPSGCELAKSELVACQGRIRQNQARLQSECGSFSDPKYTQEYKQNLNTAIEKALAMKGDCPRGCVCPDGRPCGPPYDSSGQPIPRCAPTDGDPGPGGVNVTR